MASQFPAKLKAADLTRFNVRAEQLENVKPVISYWCHYWIVNQILSKGLHNEDPETLQYTTTLMEKLEQIKAENAGNHAIVHDTAGQAYVEQFGLETFLRADRAVQANKVTKQTADTFLAAATFMELVNIWGSIGSETAAKIKYAKWNAVRIMKAFKEDRDPNESNPKSEPAQEEGLPALDPRDPEVQLGLGRQPTIEDVPDEQDLFEAKMAPQSSIDRSLHSSAQVSTRASPAPPHEASVEDVPDEQDQVEARLARQSVIDQSLHSSAQVSSAASPTKYEPFPRDRNPYTGTGPDEPVSPLEPSPNDRATSVGGGYFPEVPTFTSEIRDPTTLTAPAPDEAINMGLPDTSNLQAPGNGAFAPSPQDFYKQVTPPIQPPQPQYLPRPQQPAFPPLLSQTPHSPTPAPHPAPAQLSSYGPLLTDDVSIAKAQKHARFAISALNFEDAETAVKELKAALQTLGAQ